MGERLLHENKLSYKKCLFLYLPVLFVLNNLISATNKTGALSEVIANMTDMGMRAGMYRGGTFDGLMKMMTENNDTAVGVFDELYSFLDNIDRGVAGNLEKGKFALHFNNCVLWYMLCLGDEGDIRGLYNYALIDKR